MPDRSGEFILAVLGSALEQGHHAVLKTALIKFLYLADYHAARERNGEPWTDWEWRFMHFGPFAVSAAIELDGLVQVGRLMADERASQAGDKEYVLYSLPEGMQTPSLRFFDFPSSAMLALQADIKRYGNNLSTLLDYIYFHTEPMETAKPGQLLDFGRCTKHDAADFRHVEMKKLRPKAIKKFRAQLRELINQRKSGEQITAEGPFDQTYFEGIAELEGDSLGTGLTGRAAIKVD